MHTKNIKTFLFMLVGVGIAFIEGSRKTPEYSSDGNLMKFSVDNNEYILPISLLPFFNKTDLFDFKFFENKLKELPDKIMISDILIIQKIRKEIKIDIDKAAKLRYDLNPNKKLTRKNNSIKSKELELNQLNQLNQLNNSIKSKELELEDINLKSASDNSEESITKNVFLRMLIYFGSRQNDKIDFMRERKRIPEHETTALKEIKTKNTVVSEAIEILKK